MLSRWEVWLLYISTAVLTITGLAYAGMHYLMEPVDAFSVVNHPWEPYMMKVHIVIAPLLVIAVGIILRGHILLKLEAQNGAGRKSGILLIPMFLLMVLSGYLLQVVHSEFRKIVVILHFLTGMIWFGSFVAHQIASIRHKKQMMKQNLNRRSGLIIRGIENHGRTVSVKPASEHVPSS